MPAVAALPAPSAASSGSAPAASSLPPAIAELVEIFAASLAEVRFPGVDHQALAELAARVEADEARVRALRADLEAAEAAHADAHERLLRAAELGLAYARVYASDDEALQARLAGLSLGGASPRKGRKLEVAGKGGAGAIKLPPRRARKPRAPAEGGEA